MKIDTYNSSSEKRRHKQTSYTVLHVINWKRYVAQKWLGLYYFTSEVRSVNWFRGLCVGHPSLIELSIVCNRGTQTEAALCSTHSYFIQLLNNTAFNSQQPRFIPFHLEIGVAKPLSTQIHFDWSNSRSNYSSLALLFACNVSYLVIISNACG